LESGLELGSQMAVSHWLLTGLERRGEGEVEREEVSK